MILRFFKDLFVEFLKFFKCRLFIKNSRKSTENGLEHVDITESNNSECDYLFSMIIPTKWTIFEDHKDCICALAEQICTVKTSDSSQINPK